MLLRPHHVEGEVLDGLALVGPEVVELVEYRDLGDLGEGGGEGLVAVDLHQVPQALGPRSQPADVGEGPVLVQDVHVLLGVEALVLQPEEPVVEGGHGLVHPVVGVLLGHLDRAIYPRGGQLLPLEYEGRLVEGHDEVGDLAGLVLGLRGVARVPHLPEHLLQVVVLVHEVDELADLVLLRRPEDQQDVVHALYHAVPRRLLLLVHPVVGGGVDPVLLLVVVQLLGQLVQVVVEHVDVVAVGHAVHGVLVEVGHLRVVLEDELVELVEDPQLELVLLEEGQDVLHGQPLLDGLLRPVQEVQDDLPGDDVALLVRAQEGVPVGVVDGVEEALVLDVPLLHDRLPEGTPREVQLVGAVHVLDHDLVPRPVGHAQRRHPLALRAGHVADDVDPLGVAGHDPVSVGEGGVGPAEGHELPPVPAAPLHQLVVDQRQEVPGGCAAGDRELSLPEGSHPLEALLQVLLVPLLLVLGQLSVRGPVPLGGVEHHVQVEVLHPRPPGPQRLVLPLEPARDGHG